MELFISMTNNRSKFAGVVKYVGILDDNLVAPKCYVGVHLDDQGRHLFEFELSDKTAAICRIIMVDKM